MAQDVAGAVEVNTEPGDDVDDGVHPVVVFADVALVHPDQRVEKNNGLWISRFKNKAAKSGYRFNIELNLVPVVGFKRFAYRKCGGGTFP